MYMYSNETAGVTIDVLRSLRRERKRKKWASKTEDSASRQIV